MEGNLYKSMETGDVSVKCLADFDEKYFHSIAQDGENEWIAIGMENCKNQRYYTVLGENNIKLGIVGVYDTDDDQNITHILIDPELRGKGLLQKFYAQLMREEKLPFLTATINIDNLASVKSQEKAGFEKVSDKAYEDEYHKYKYIKR